MLRNALLEARNCYQSISPAIRSKMQWFNKRLGLIKVAKLVEIIVADVIIIVACLTVIKFFSSIFRSDLWDHATSCWQVLVEGHLYMMKRRYVFEMSITTFVESWCVDAFKVWIILSGTRQAFIRRINNKASTARELALSKVRRIW